MPAGSSPSSAPTALISWAHRDPGWTDEEAKAWTASVVTLARLLRDNGVDAELDLWHITDPTIDWTRWGPQQVNGSDYTLVVLSSGWQQRWDGTNSPKQGAGAVAEADTLKGRFNEDQSEFQKRTILVLLPEVPTTTVPTNLQRLHRVQIPDLTQRGVEDLLRVIHRAPAYVKPELRPAPALPPLDVQPRNTPQRRRDMTLDETATAWAKELRNIENLKEPRPQHTTFADLANEAVLLQGALRGMPPKNYRPAKFEIYQDARGEYRFRLKAGNGEVVATGEGYKTRAGAIRGVEAVKRAVAEAAGPK